MDATNKAVGDTNTVKEALDDTADLFGDKLKELSRQAEDMAHQKDTVSNVLSEKVSDISNAAQKTGSGYADAVHLLDEDANRAMYSLKREVEDVTHKIFDTAHHVSDTVIPSKAEMAGDALKC